MWRSSSPSRAIGAEPVRVFSVIVRKNAFVNGLGLSRYSAGPSEEHRIEAVKGDQAAVTLTTPRRSHRPSLIPIITRWPRHRPLRQLREPWCEKPERFTERDV
jgi:hypothetical protein